MARLLLPPHLLFVLITAVLWPIVQLGAIEDIPIVISVLIFSFYILALCGLIYWTYAVVILRFYKSLFSDSGYLTWTLPATPGQLLLSKTLASSLCSVADVLILAGCVVLLLNGPLIGDSWGHIFSEITAETGMDFGKFLLSTLGISLLGNVGSSIAFFAFIAFGQLFSKQRILISVVAYFVVNILLSFVMMIGMVAAGIYSNTSYWLTDTNSILSTSYSLSAVFVVIESVVCYIFTYYVMSKKVNLQ